MDIENNKSCKDCKFFGEPLRHEDYTCRIYPPIIFESRQYGIITWWPEVRHFDWCGKFEPE